MNFFPDFPKDFRHYLLRYINGEDVNLSDSEFEKATIGVSDFTRHVLKGLLDIPRGQVITYKTLADKIGQPKAVRAVASALGRNPLPVLIPCHRVVAAQGGIGGYAFGLEAKKYLLALEINEDI